jgi:hypothetical protein
LTFTATGPNDFIDYVSFTVATGNLANVSLGPRAWNIVIVAPDLINFLEINTTNQSNSWAVSNPSNSTKLQERMTILGGVFNVRFEGSLYDNLLVSNTPFAYYHLDIQGDFCQNLASGQLFGVTALNAPYGLVFLRQINGITKTTLFNRTVNSSGTPTPGDRPLIRSTVGTIRNCVLYPGAPQDMVISMQPGTAIINCHLKY